MHRYFPAWSLSPSFTYFSRNYISSLKYKETQRRSVLLLSAHSFISRIDRITAHRISSKCGIDRLISFFTRKNRQLPPIPAKQQKPPEASALFPHRLCQRGKGRSFHPPISSHPFIMSSISAVMICILIAIRGHRS